MSVFNHAEKIVDATAAAVSVTASVDTAINDAIKEDHQFIRDFVPEAAILSLTNEYVTVVIIRTQYSKVQLRIKYLPAYPDVIPIVDITSSTLPIPLLRNKENECLDKAREHIGKPQIAIIYSHIYSFIQRNMFVSCWKEMKQVVTLCEGKGQLGCDEKEGTLHMKLKCGDYYQGIKLIIPQMYPEEGVSIEFTTSNFPSDIMFMFKAQANEIVRRCESGIAPELASTQTTGINKNVALKKQGDNTNAIAVTSSNLKTMKHDINVLKQISDLRVATNARDKKFQYSLHANAERREARKDLRRLVKIESEADEEQERLLRESEQMEMKLLLGLKVSENSQPSLYAAAKYLCDDYVCRLPQEPCQACKKPIFHVDPTNEAMTSTKNAHRPMRTFCGHWLHYQCLNEWLTTPPFIRDCPVCSRRIWHPDWPEDHKLLEKAWNKQEERKREISDVSDMMGF